MNNYRKSQRQGLFLIIILLIGATVLLLRFNPLYLGVLSDKDIISIFHQHRAELVKLQKMISADKVSYVTEQYDDPNLTRARWRKYQIIMRKINHRLTVTYTPQSICFTLSRGGFLSIGPKWAKGIEYVNISKTVGMNKQTLNNPGDLAYDEVYNRKIQRHWYVFFKKTHE